MIVCIYPINEPDVSMPAKLTIVDASDGHVVYVASFSAAGSAYLPADLQEEMRKRRVKVTLEWHE